MHVLKRLSVSAVLLILGACSVGPEYSRTQTRATLGAEYVGVGQLGMREQADLRWWLDYRDPVLAAWVERLQQQNLDLKSLAERLLQARERVAVQRAGWWPALGVNAGGRRSFAPDLLNPDERTYTSTIEASGVISWQADLFGRIESAVASARYSALAAEADYRALEHSLIAELVNRRAVVVLLLQEIGIQKQIVDSRQGTLETVARRYRLGVPNATAVGVFTARENASSARAQLLLLQQQLEETLLIVDVLLDLQPGTLYRDQTSLADTLFPPMPPTQIPDVARPAQLLDMRPDIKAAEFRVVAANADIGVAVADLFPDLNFSLTRGFAGDQAGGLLRNNNAVGALAGQLTTRLFEGGRLRAQIRQSEARARELAFEYARVVLSAVAEVETALVQEQYLRQRVNELRISVDAARQAGELAEARYQRGISPLLELLETQRRRQVAERALLGAQREAWAARINLQLALGPRWPAPALSLNNSR